MSAQDTIQGAGYGMNEYMCCYTLFVTGATSTRQDSAPATGVRTNSSPNKRVCRFVGHLGYDLCIEYMYELKLYVLSMSSNEVVDNVGGWSTGRTRSARWPLRVVSGIACFRNHRPRAQIGWAGAHIPKH